MAIRLYPNVTPQELERLCGVPSGTHDKLIKFEKERPKTDGHTMTAWYDKLYKDQDMVLLNNFLTFGWGRLTGEAMKYKKEHFPDSEYSGSTDDPTLAQGFIQAMGITAEGITSVHWS
jgi:hypothetical protein